MSQLGRPPLKSLFSRHRKLRRLFLRLVSHPVANMRVCGSDTRVFRLAAIPSVIVGCTSYGMGAEDEYVILEQMVQVSQIHALIAYDFLKQESL
jgi:hypothetical protein